MHIHLGWFRRQSIDSATTQEKEGRLFAQVPKGASNTQDVEQRATIARPKASQ